MQRLFSMFPQGGPGIGLLMLRLSVAALFLMDTINRFGTSPSALLRLAAIAIALISISLTIGFLTPFMSVIACVAAGLNLLSGLNSGSIIYVFAIFNAAALVLLGPGAYSLDARLFGLRVTVVPPRRKRV